MGRICINSSISQRKILFSASKINNGINFTAIILVIKSKSIKNIGLFIVPIVNTKNKCT